MIIEDPTNGMHNRILRERESNTYFNGINSNITALRLAVTCNIICNFPVVHSPSYGNMPFS